MKKDKEWLKEAIRGMCRSSVLQYITVNVDVLDNLIDQLDEPEKAFVSKKETIEVPQFVANHIEGSKQMGKRLNVALSESPETEMILQMNITIFEANNIYARAWLDGYTVEKEKKYRVVFPMGINPNKLIKKISTGVILVDSELYYSRDTNDEFTEQEIKAIDERYWAFAEQVTE